MYRDVSGCENEINGNRKKVNTEMYLSNWIWFIAGTVVILPYLYKNPAKMGPVNLKLRFTSKDVLIIDFQEKIPQLMPIKLYSLKYSSTFVSGKAPWNPSIRFPFLS